LLQGGNLHTQTILANLYTGHEYHLKIPNRKYNLLPLWKSQVKKIRMKFVKISAYHKFSGVLLAQGVLAVEGKSLWILNTSP
jgi:hypothetical protein